MSGTSRSRRKTIEASGDSLRLTLRPVFAPEVSAADDAEVSIHFVALRILVHILTLLHCSTHAFCGIHQLGSELSVHGLRFRSFPGRVDDPLERKPLCTRRCRGHGHLKFAPSAGGDASQLHKRCDILHGDCEHCCRLVARDLCHDVQGAEEHALGHGLFPIIHHEARHALLECRHLPPERGHVCIPGEGTNGNGWITQALITQQPLLLNVLRHGRRVEDRRP
mmetsp:Transcript_502/g.1271  ORF Transcript_502/g.1271 Transcript_502/m.1271 type:complete len:223 (+) Transcript_502:2-670(+)